MSTSEQQEMFGRNIRFLRDKNGWEQEDLERKIGVGKGNVSNWERGENKARRDTIKKLAKLFDVNADDLVERDLSKSGKSEKPIVYTQEEIDAMITARMRELERRISVLERLVLLDGDRLSSLESRIT